MRNEIQNLEDIDKESLEIIDEFHNKLDKLKNRKSILKDDNEKLKRSINLIEINNKYLIKEINNIENNVTKDTRYVK